MTNDARTKPSDGGDWKGGFLSSHELPSKLAMILNDLVFIPAALWAIMI